MRIFLKNSEGQPSVSLTMVVVSFGIVTLWLVAWLVGVTLGHPVPEFDATSAMAYLTPQLGLYFGRRYTSKTDASTKTVETSIDGAPPVVVSTTTQTSN
jgi:hypothetical protein